VTTVHVLVPDGIDDRPSGGNTYDRQVCACLAAQGWDVRRHSVAGAWPEPADVDGLSGPAGAVAGLTAGLPDGALVLVDGLVAAAADAVLAAQAERLRLVVLVHMLFPGESAVLAAAAAVLVTSRWSRDELLARYPVPADRVRIAPPGTEPAEPTPGSADGNRLLCVAALAPHKGQDVLVAALAELAERSWQCSLVGPLDRDPVFVDRLRHQLVTAGLSERIRLTGPRTGRALAAAYGSADLLVLASRTETYGMVVTEALARGVPVLATAVGGVPEALGRDADGDRPGLLVPADDPAALAGALRRWLDDAGLRERLRAAARNRRQALTGWDATAKIIGTVLAEVGR